jgi:hypothetical protein
MQYFYDKSNSDYRYYVHVGFDWDHFNADRSVEDNMDKDYYFDNPDIAMDNLHEFEDIRLIVCNPMTVPRHGHPFCVGYGIRWVS